MEHVCTDYHYGSDFPNYHESWTVPHNNNNVYCGAFASSDTAPAYYDNSLQCVYENNKSEHNTNTIMYAHIPNQTQRRHCKVRGEIMRRLRKQAKTTIRHCLITRAGCMLVRWILGDPMDFIEHTNPVISNLCTFFYRDVLQRRAMNMHALPDIRALMRFDDICEQLLPMAHFIKSAIIRWEDVHKKHHPNHFLVLRMEIERVINGEPPSASTATWRPHMLFYMFTIDVLQSIGFDMSYGVFQTTATALKIFRIDPYSDPTLFEHLEAEDALRRHNWNQKCAPII